MVEFTGATCRGLRLEQGWTLQQLANRSGVNKAYLSEFENGLRELTPEMLAAVRDAFQPPAGHARPALRRDDHDALRLVFVDERGAESYRPDQAWIEWLADDGTRYRMFVGHRGA